jgi:hypothetical protein
MSACKLREPVSGKNNRLHFIYGINDELQYQVSLETNTQFIHIYKVGRSVVYAEIYHFA